MEVMNQDEFNTKLAAMLRQHNELIARKNATAPHGNGVYDRWINPVVTAAHVPLFWRYDLNHQTNPHLMERIGVNATFNAGAIELEGSILLVLRVEGADRKSFFAVAVIDDEIVIDPRVYHTIKEVKNGLGPAPIKTEKGWLQLAHGVRNTAAGLRYVLYLFLSDLDEPWRITHLPAGYFLAPEGDERVGDVSNVVFSNGWLLRESGEVLIYYASSDTRMHVATSTVDRLLDYVINTPPDRLRSYACVEQRCDLIARNPKLLSGRR
jgi:predicted GH43/DUF377 family glycosyl hydrolase